MTKARLVNPSLKGVFGSEVELSDGSKVKADENYVRESLELPQAKIVKGFETMPPMPTFKGQLTDAQINAIISYLSSLK